MCRRGKKTGKICNEYKNPTTNKQKTDMRNPGTIIKLKDGRRCIVYNNQPLLALKRKFILSLVDEHGKPILNEFGSPIHLIKSVADYNTEMQTSTLIGYVD